MFKHCVRCGAVKLWFLFWTKFMGIYTFAPNVCKACASDIAYVAISDYLNLKVKP